MLDFILIPLLVGIIVQAIKLIIDGIPNNFSWQHIVSDYGGMPSAHTAFVSALLVIVGIKEGFGSAAFAISFILLIIVVRDAIGFRREIGRNAALTNFIAKNTLKNKKINYLTERVGHTLPEVAAGFVIGGALAVFFYLTFLMI
ncbi:MAG: divergent PAP2 family protein [Patescibacteria group bacterium]